MENPYLPYPVRIDDIIVETEDRNLKTFKFVFLDPADETRFAYQAGQFAELSIPGKGEIPIGIASSPVEKGFVKFTVNKAGVVTQHLHNMKAGDIMGIRGPLGNWYPWEGLAGKNLLIVGGGFAFTTLRSSIIYMLDPANRAKFGNKAVRVLSSGPASEEEADHIAREPAYANLSELGLGVLGDFGLNPTGSILLDEKLGLHIAFGRSDHFGGTVEVLVNNAGLFKATPLDSSDIEWLDGWEETLRINLTAAGRANNA